MGEREHRVLIHLVGINARIYRQVYLGDPHAKRNAVQQHLKHHICPRYHGFGHTRLCQACGQAVFIDRSHHRQWFTVCDLPDDHVCRDF